MSLDFEDSNSGFEMISSQPDKPSEKPSYKSVPEDQVFRFKLISQLETKPKKVCYKLRKGLDLPYVTDSGGFQITFSSVLEPSVAKYEISSQEGDSYVLKLLTVDPDLQADQTGELEEVTEGSFGDHEAGVQIVGKDIGDIVVIEAQEEELNELLKFVENNVKRNDRIFKYNCSLCSYIGERAIGCVDHIVENHPDWKHELNFSSSGPVAGISQNNLPSTSSIDQDNPLTSTAYTNPDWLKSLKRNFRPEIIDNLASDVREAVAKDMKIDDKKHRRSIRNAIINSVVSYIVNIFGGVSRPKIGQVREIVTEMQFVYPAMFRDEDGGTGYGFGGGKGNDGLANQMLDRIRKVEHETKKPEVGAVIEEAVGRKKGKKPDVYGVNNDKWYVETSAGGNRFAASSISKANEEPEFAEREKIYEENRLELVKQFRESRKSIQNVCRKFMEHPDHLENHFKYLTSTDGLTAVVEKNFKHQIDLLQKYLMHCNQTVEFSDFIEGLEVTCQVEYEGSQIYKYIQILRKAGDNLDKDGAALFRLESDGPPSTDSPHILAICRGSSWIFEVWVDKTKAIGNLSIVQAISSFLHMAFSFNLRYPKEAMTLADILQRRFAKYGDDTGTRTQSKKDTAKAKVDKYLMALGAMM